MNRNEVAEKIFECKPKDVHSFTFISPEINKVEGFICKNMIKNKKAGSLFITKVNGEEVNYYVQGMRKLWYYSEDFDIKNLYISIKEDGTNICMYPLLNSDNECIEVIFKTRNEPIIRKHWYKKLDKVIKPFHIERVMKLKAPCCYELFGSENKSEIFYEEDLQLKLVAIYSNIGELVDPPIISKYCNDFVEEAFKVIQNDDKYIITYTSYFENRYKKYLPEQKELHCKTIKECHEAISNFIEEININSLKDIEKNVCEGVVWNYYIKEKDDYVQIKNKASSIEEGHRAVGGISTIFIKKALKKFLDEYGMDYAKKMCKNNKQEIVNFIEQELLEDWKEKYVKMPETQQKIYKRIAIKIEDKVIDWTEEFNKKLIEIVKDLKNDYPDYTIPQLMKEFAKKYPELKKYNSKIFGYLNDVLQNNYGFWKV